MSTAINTDGVSPVTPLAEDLSELPLYKRVFAQLIDKPSDADVIANVKYEEECEASDVPYDPMATRMEIWSWLIFDFANSPMFQVGLGLTFPIFLALMATRYACLNNVPHECDYHDEPIESNDALRVMMGGWELRPASYAAAMVSISALIQAFFYVFLGALADYGSYQHYLFRIMATIAASANLVWVFFTTPDSWLFAGWWGGMTFVFFGLSLIFYNAYLPEIVANHWIVRRKQRRRDDVDSIVKTVERITDEMSQYGVACGYCGSLLHTLIAVGVFAGLSSETLDINKKFGITTTRLSKVSFSDLSVTSLNDEDELWAKPVAGANIYIAYDVSNASNTSSNSYNSLNNINSSNLTSYITGIQLTYDDIDLNGSLHGSDGSEASANTYVAFERFDVDSKDYVQSLRLWYTNDGTIGALQFVLQSGDVSQTFGSPATSTTSSSSSSSTAEVADVAESKDDAKNRIWAGFNVNVAQLDSSKHGVGSVVAGFDFLFMDEKQGQYGSQISYQLVMVLIGVWWLIFQVFPFYYLKKRSKPELPKDANVFTLSVKEYYATIKEAKKYPNLFKYLVCWFLFSDGLSSMSAMGVLFAQDELGFTSTALIVMVLELEVTAALGAVFFVWLQNRTQWDTKQMLLLHICLMMLLPTFGLLGLIPAVPFGLKNGWEMFVFIFWFGINTGSLFSYSRSFFAQLVPQGLENQMFSLYEITDKGSSWIGPLLVAFISNVTSMRWAFFYVFAIFSTSILVISKYVDLEEGLRQAGKYTREPRTGSMDRKLSRDDMKTKLSKHEHQAEPHASMQHSESVSTTGTDTTATGTGTGTGASGASGASAMSAVSAGTGTEMTGRKLESSSNISVSQKKMISAALSDSGGHENDNDEIDTE